MVLESIFSAELIRKKPYIMILEAIIVSSIALWVSYYFFPTSSSLIHIAFLVIASMPVLHNVFLVEEDEEAENPKNPVGFLSRHFDLIAIYAWLFIGLIISYSFWHFFLPSQTESFCFSEGICIKIPEREIVFMEQEKVLKEIDNLRTSLTGNAVLATEQQDKTFLKAFNQIFPTNLMVLLLAILFSFIYGAGALYLIAWNASVLAVKISQNAIILLEKTGDASLSYLTGLFYGIGFLPHGVFEITAFFVGAIAGGIISVAITKKTYRKNEFQTIAKDALVITIMAVFLIFIAAVIESYLIAIILSPA